MIFANKLLKTLLITTYLTESVISSHGDVFEVTNAESDSDIGKFVKDLKDAVKKGTKSTTPLSITQNSDCSDLSVDGKHKLEKKEIVDIGQKLIAQEQADQQQKKSTIKKLKKVFNADSENICKWISTYFENALTRVCRQINLLHIIMKEILMIA